MSVNSEIILLGASVRAAAQSAVRSGFHPVSGDLFADDDLREVSRLLPLNGFYEGLEQALQAGPDAPWMYTGGLENRPELVERLAEIRPLLGNSGRVLRLVRDPFWLAQTLKDAGIPCLDVAHERRVDDGIRWLCKPIASAGGMQIAPLPDDQSSAPTGFVLQRFATGVPISGLYLATRDQTHCLGLSQQLVGEADASAPPFGYSGSIAPLTESELPALCFEQAHHIGAVCSKRSGLRGLFGIDFMWDVEQSRLWTLEINPRYPASAELYELASGWPLIGWHVAACRDAIIDQGLLHQRGSNHTRYGKLILYAARDLSAPDIRLWAKSQPQIAIADIPAIGSFIPAGMPICTLLTQAETSADCLNKLRSGARSCHQSMARDGST